MPCSVEVLAQLVAARRADDELVVDVAALGGLVGQDDEPLLAPGPPPRTAGDSAAALACRPAVQASRCRSLTLTMAAWSASRRKLPPISLW